MEKLLIEGGTKLKGKVKISGFKNAALPVIAATLLAGDKCTIENLPLIKDVIVYKEIMSKLGADVSLSDKGVMEIDTSKIKKCNAPYELATKIRASYYLLGAALGRFSQAQAPPPGGCSIGNRPIDQHIKGFEALGAKVDISHGIINCKAEKLKGEKIYLDVVTVGATINIMLASVLTEGKTVIENAAKEPHIVDVANFLNAMGAEIRGAGTDVIRVQGVNKLKGCTYSIIPDQIEAGTYMIATAATGGEVIIDNVIPTHLESITAKLKEMNVKIKEYGDSIRVYAPQKIKSVDVKTLPYPGFPTDLQQPMSVLLCHADGTSIVTETVSEDRFKYVDELKRMGARIKVDGRVAVIQGINKLSAAKVAASDLRGGVAMVIAGLVADGVTEVENAYHIDRGYEGLENKLLNLGAKVKRIKI